MKPEDIIDFYKNDSNVNKICEILVTEKPAHIFLGGLTGSSASVLSAGVIKNISKPHVFILPDKESAAYFYNDLEALFEDGNVEFFKKKVLFFPAPYKRTGDYNNIDRTNLLQRTETLKRLQSGRRNPVFVTYPEALCEKVTSAGFLRKNTLRLTLNETVSMDFFVEMLSEYSFEAVDFVVEPGQYAVRGGIIDVFSYSNDRPYRIEFDGDQVGSLRTFDPVNQLSCDNLNHITVVSNVLSRSSYEQRVSFLSFLAGNAVIWIDDVRQSVDRLDNESRHILAEGLSKREDDEYEGINPELITNGNTFLKELEAYHVIEFNHKYFNDHSLKTVFETVPQQAFNKNFDLLFSTIAENHALGYKNIILTSTAGQAERFKAIFEDLQSKNKRESDVFFTAVSLNLHQGFTDKRLKIAYFTDHQIFERYHRFRLKDSLDTREAITVRDIYNLNPGDYVTHIDHGVGRFAGLEKIEVNGRKQEAIRLLYQNNDLLYVSIHSLHRISKYSGREGTAPSLDKLGGNTWNKLKNRTKQKVKDIAKDLIALYAKRRASKGFEFTPDTYLQHELEASFIYEDTPDQITATIDVKKDMEAPFPMDRLICGDVGFGKTEIAIRAAFKAVADSKQVAVLVPTTILALQHFKTFSERLKGLPCNISYINRFKTAAEQKKILIELKEKKIDILIGTHRLISKDIIFEDLGLLIVDEEQKFGVAAKEKLKNLRVNVDTLTLTATPIPRTLQFSLMGARDLSIIKTPPPNRYPVKTELCSFSEDIIKNAINYEISRGGQIFFVHNRIENIIDVANMIERFCPDVNIAIGHGRLEGEKLEQIMLDFIEGKYDVLVSTTIIESGLDIPNANTIIINDAQNYGLSDLHQLRGRVGRTNRKAFCYLLSPPLIALSDEARKRLKAIEEYSDLGSGFNIAMRDLDIRGAGNILGAEQSGFISDIGFEMYQKILQEAITELKETEFAGMFPEEPQKDFVKECQIETDLELMIPDSYVDNITERLSLYKELDSIENEENLKIFISKLTDRFGNIPSQVQELFCIVRLRWLARKAGIEKVILKNGKLSAHFISNPESGYFETQEFQNMLKWVNNQKNNCRLREVNNRLTLMIENTNSALAAYKVFTDLYSAIEISATQPESFN